MATGGLGSQSVKNTCSICLEPFKGRSPKLLPCFHTFCCQCLEQIVDTATAGQATLTLVSVPQIYNHGVKEITIRCPTCRKECLVPSGGASEFQTNFYVEQEEDRNQGHLQPIICDLCDQGQVASHRCTRCNLILCFHCNKSHGNCKITSKSSAKTWDLSNQTNESQQHIVQTLFSRGRDQLESFEKMLNHLKEEDMEFNRRRKEIEDKLIDLLDKQMKSIKSMAEAEDEKRKQEQTDLQNICDQLKQSLPLNNPSILEPLLLHDSELSSLKAKRYSEEKVDCFASVNAFLNKMSTISSTSNMSLGTNLPQYFGRHGLSYECASLAVVQKEHETSRLNELESKLEVLMKSVHGTGTHGDNDKLVDEVRTMHDKNSILLQDVANLQAENNSLRQEFLKFQAGFDELAKNHTVLTKQSSGMSSDVIELQKNLTTHHVTLKEIQDKVNKEMKDMKQTQQKLSEEMSLQASGKEKDSNDLSLFYLSSQISDLKIQLNVLRLSQSSHPPYSAMAEESNTLLGDVDNKVRRLQSAFATLIGSLSNRVAFSTYLHAAVRTRSVRTLIFKTVESNIGNGYDGSTGIFQAPVSGLYLLYASAIPVDEDRVAKFGVMKKDAEYLDDNSSFELFTVESSDVDAPCNGQLVVHLDKGCKVFAETYADKSSFLDDDSGTYFCGVLLQPDMDLCFAL